MKIIIEQKYCSDARPDQKAGWFLTGWMRAASKHPDRCLELMRRANAAADRVVSRVRAEDEQL